MSETKYGIICQGQIYIGDGLFSNHRDQPPTIFQNRPEADTKASLLQKNHNEPLTVIPLTEERLRGYPFCDIALASVKWSEGLNDHRSRRK